MILNIDMYALINTDGKRGKGNPVTIDREASFFFHSRRYCYRLILLL